MHSLKNQSVLCLKIKNYMKSFSANGLCFLVRGVNRCTQEKTSQSRVEEQQIKLNQQIEKSQATLMEGEYGMDVHPVRLP